MKRILLAAMTDILLATAAYAADWPTYGATPGRTGYTSVTPPGDLTLSWSFRAAHAPAPAWPRSDRLQEDRAYQVVVADETVFFGSSADGRLYAVDASRGELKWTFQTDAPIRFAPAIWKDRVFVASDDGYLYALTTESGRLLWKRRGGPDHQSVLGNEQVISKWPARGGPVVFGDTVYFAAGIWPSDGVYLYALNAETGETLWCNDDSGDIEMPQPHGGAVARSGVAAQGYLVATEDQLFVPTGRAVPAAFERQSGVFQYFHLQQFGQNGGSAAAAIGPLLFNGGMAFDAHTGQKQFSLGPGPVAATADGVVHANGSKLVAYALAQTDKPDRRGEAAMTASASERWSITLKTPCPSLIVAGTRVIAGGAGLLTMLDLDTGAPTWSAEVEGTVYGLAATEESLFASTDRGVIYRFGRSQVGSASATRSATGSPYSDDSLQSRAAKEIVHRFGQLEGYCVDLGCGDGALAYHLARQTGLHVYAVDDDSERVAEAREKLTAAGLYGVRVTVHQRDLRDTGYPEYFANLVVSGRSLWDGAVSVPMEEARRLQRPYGGLICVGDPENLACSTRGPLPGAGQWTHQYGDSANTVCSEDALVQGRLGMLWFRDVDFEIPSRHGRAPSPLFEDGRLFHLGLNGVIAVDAYNGHILWQHEIPSILKAYDGDELMGTAGVGGVMCASQRRVYIRHEARCLCLDAVTGKTLAEFTAPEHPTGTRGVWGYIACKNGTLFGSLANTDHLVTYRYVNRGGDMARLWTESRGLFAMDASTGKLKWTYPAADSIRHNAIAIADGKVFVIDRPAAQFDRVKKSDVMDHPTGRLLALDAETGRILWQRENDIYGTMLAASERHDVVLMSYQPSGFRLDSEFGGRMTALHSDDGRQLWEVRSNYQSRPIIIDRTIYAQGGAWDLLTGEPERFDFQRSYGCGILAAGAHMLLFRSATLGYYDLSGQRQTRNYGGIRPGCWINAIAAGGLAFVPDATAGCSCSYLNRAWVALQPQSSAR